MQQQLSYLCVLTALPHSRIFQVTSAFARRGYNVQSLAVGPAETPGDSRITMVVPGTQRGISTLLKHILKLVSVKEVTDLTPMPYTTRELMLVKVRTRVGL